MLDLLLNNMSFRYLMGGLTPINHPHDTGWRQLPCWVLAVPVGGRILVETEKHGLMSCEDGCATVVEPNRRHAFRFVPHTDLVIYWSHVLFSLPGGMDIADLLETPVVTTAGIGRRIARLNRDLTKLQSLPAANPLTVAGRYLELGFGLLSTLCGISREKSGRNLLSVEASRIRDLLVFIDEYLHTPLDRDRLAKRCRLSPARFHVVFHQVVGVSPMTFVTQQRMKKAQFLLAETTLPIKRIGDMVGYSDPYIFSRAFKNTTGICPKFYRTRAKPAFPPALRGES